MTGWLTRKAAATIGSVGAGLLGFTTLWHPAKSVPQPIRILFAYPVTYLEPTLYDDWESVFIGNHIYPRLLPEDDNAAIPSVARDVSTTCAEPASPEIGPGCRRVRLSFSMGAFTDCVGRRYDADAIRAEFARLLAAKSWALPDWKFCAAPTSAVCVTAANTGDIARRLKDVNFRFGWSKRDDGDRLVGAGPYCLSAERGPRGEISEGVLTPRDPAAPLPPMSFSTGGGKDAAFDVALYGSDELLAGGRKNVQAHTPLAYYVVTNPRLAGRHLPWNSPWTRSAIRDHFVRRGVFFDQAPEIERLVPAGAALVASNDGGHPESAGELAIPDYLPGCRELAASLTHAWRGAARARCVDIVEYVQRRVRERRGSWSAFLVGLSSADPGRDAIELQYFSPASKDSLTYGYLRPDRLYYLAGIGQSLVTVDGRHVCDLKPNALGLGNVFATDFVRCGR